MKMLWNACFGRSVSQRLKEKKLNYPVVRAIKNVNENESEYP